jgi:O-antigen ligase
MIRRMSVASRAPALVLMVLPGALVVYFGFNGGGFFPGTPALVALLLTLALFLRIALADNPFGGFSKTLILAVAALALYALWTLLSAVWSDAPARAVIEFDRALLYLLALVLFASFPHDPARLRWMLRALALGILVVCAAGLVSRTLPDLWPTSPNIGNERLSYPLTYWNALGLLASFGLLLCLHLTSCEREPKISRVLAAAAVSPLASVLLLTFSRGAIAAAVVAGTAYLALARPRGAVAGLLATAPLAAIAVARAYDATLLATPDPTVPAAVDQGNALALTIGLCALGSALLRFLLLPLDARLAGLHSSPGARRALGGLAMLASVGAVIALLAFDVPATVSHQVDRFAKGGKSSAAPVRDRLSDFRSQGRIDQWDVALDAFGNAPLHGYGAGTYELLWAQNRPVRSTVVDAHSLYLEALSELGVVGLGLLAVAIGALLGGVAAHIRGPNRALYAAVLAGGLAWALRAGVDWDWEMPAVTLWVFALGGAAAAPVGRQPRRERGIVPRAPLAIGCLALGIVPTLVLGSQAWLGKSRDAFARGDCATAVRAARSADSVLAIRPESYEIIGYCDARGGLELSGVGAMEKAVKRDPRNWVPRYGLALTRAAAGLDPRRAARKALELNPLEPLTKDAVRRLGGERPRRWRRQARPLLAKPVL